MENKNMERVNIKIESYELSEYILAETIKYGVLGELVKEE